MSVLMVAESKLFVSFVQFSAASSFEASSFYDVLKLEHCIIPFCTLLLNSFYRSYNDDGHLLRRILLVFIHKHSYHARVQFNRHTLFKYTSQQVARPTKRSVLKI